MRIPFISLIAASSIALGGCAYGGLGFGYGDGYSSYGYNGYGYNGYGYDGGYGSPYGYNGYGGYGGGYGGYGYGYGSPYSGWYGNYYYPGTGYYVYDSYRRPIRWSDDQRRYWTSRADRARRSGVTVSSTPNWGGFTRTRTQGQVRGDQVARQRIEAARDRVEQRREDRAATRTTRTIGNDRSTEDSTPRHRRR